ncbi:MAG TPA: alkaline phosphatase family protein [Nocardioides sp.]|uniref:alkaline phosphatase family protein n=1 Tax=Nocardioides sp. TaxID=35761 RepID=UPI002D7F0B35|nr:alkaline phosphatase family protein [Nocardioides sp.]HET6653403.1 alkaline phosphatase family protein [Nocardioides sp.]
MPLTRPTVVAAALAVVMLAGCPGPSDDPEASTLAGASDAPATEVRTARVVEHVIAISVDGLNPDAIRRLGPSGAPALHRLLAQGAGTLNARTERELTRTLPNHTGMVTGRPILGPDGHGVTVNEDNGSTVHASAGRYVASVFDVVHDHGGSTALYSSKDKLDLIDRSWDAAHGSRDRTGADDGRDKIDRYRLDTEPDNVSRLVSRLGSVPDDLSFVHLAEPDAAGHASGFMSSAYLDGVRAADRQIGRILSAVSADGDLRDQVAVVLTADHGGLGGSHSDATRAADFTVPFVVWGPGVARGADLYALNEDRRTRPGRARSSYDGSQPVRNAEVANVVTGLLGLPDVPGSALGRRQLQVS